MTVFTTQDFIYSVERFKNKLAEGKTSSEAAEEFKTIPVSHDELFAITQTYPNLSVCCKEATLLFSHPNWDTQWVLHQLTNKEPFKPFNVPCFHVASKIIQATTNQELITATLNSYQRPDYVRLIMFPNSNNLNKTNLLLALKKNFTEVASDPRLDAETLTEHYRQYTTFLPQWGSPREMFLTKVGYNPNITPELLAEVVKSGLGDDNAMVYTNPKLKPQTLQILVNRSIHNLPQRLLLVKNPSLPLTVLRKYAKSRNPLLAQQANRRIQQHEKVLQDRKTNRF